MKVTVLMENDFPICVIKGEPEELEMARLEHNSRENHDSQLELRRMRYWHTHVFELHDDASNLASKAT